MRQVPNHVFDEMLAVTKAFNDRVKPDSLRYINAVRRASRLHKKLLKLRDGQKQD